MKNTIKIFTIIVLIVIITSILLIYINNNKMQKDILEQQPENIILEENDIENSLIQNKVEEEIEEEKTVTQSYTASDGNTYEIVAILNIPTLGIEYPVLSSTSTELLKISLNKYWGPNPNTVGNFCILGHNYNDDRFFGKLNQIKNNDIIQLKDMKGKTVEYSVYDTYLIEPSDTSCTSQITEGKKEVTLITCNSTGAKRFVVKAIEEI